MVLLAFLEVSTSILYFLGRGEEARLMFCKRYYFGKHQMEIKFRLAGIPAKQ